MPLKIISHLKKVYQNAVEKIADDPIRPLSPELRASFTVAIDELDELQRLADENLQHVGNILAAMPNNEDLTKNIDVISHQIPDPNPAYVELATIQKELEARLGEPEQYPDQRMVLEWRLRNTRTQMETLTKLDGQVADLKVALVYQKHIEKCIPLLEIATGCLERLLPLWSESIMNVLVFEQAKASVEATLKEIRDDIGEGDVLSRVLAAVVHASRVLLDMTSLLIACVSYLRKLHTKAFTSDPDLKALSALTPKVHKMLEGQRNVSTVLRDAATLITELSPQEKDEPSK